MKLAFDAGGEGDRLLVLLHGLGATRHVWQPFIGEGRWQGTWIAPDLRGHGASPHATAYGLGQHAADVGTLINATGAWRDVVIVGHSMGGVVALGLASGWFGTLPSRVFGIGIKVAWTDEEVERLREMAAQPVKSFATKDEAVARYLKTSGLMGLVTEDSAAATAGVIADGSAWRLASDPKTMSVGAPPMRQLLAAAQAPVHLARGDGDRMVTGDALRGYDPASIDFAGAGHNAMVENPRAVWDWIEARLA